MTVHELNRAQLHELKVDWLLSHQERVSYGELADADSLVLDETIYEEYAGTHFVPDDFFSTATCEYAGA